MEIAEKRNEHADITEMKCLNGVSCGLSLFLLAPWSGAFSRLTVWALLCTCWICISDDVQVNFVCGAQVLCPGGKGEQQWMVVHGVQLLWQVRWWRQQSPHQKHWWPCHFHVCQSSSENFCFGGLFVCLFVVVCCGCFACDGCWDYVSVFFFPLVWPITL